MPDHDRFAGVRLQQARFPDDTGEQPPDVAEALVAHAAGTGSRLAVLAALQGSRLLVPVVAVADEVEYDEQGLAHDKSSDMAAVLLRGRDGRLALLAFTGTTPLRRWNPDGRPVAVPTELAATSALQERADALLVDVAGEVPFVVAGQDLVGLANGWTLAEVDGQPAWLAPAPGPEGRAPDGLADPDSGR
jgi:hypothetical protein